MEEAKGKMDLATYLANQEKEIIQRETKLEGLEADLSDFEAKVDQEFITHYVKNISAKDRSFIEVGDLESGDDSLEPKLAMILAARTQFVDDVVEKRRKEVTTLKDELGAKKQDFQLNKIAAEFQKLHPEVDMRDFGKFIMDELSPMQVKKLTDQATGDMLKYYELVLVLYNKAKGRDKKAPADDFPPDLDTLGGASSNGQMDVSAPKTPFSDRKY